jgi:large subunit ribosomal protein L15
MKYNELNVQAKKSRKRVGRGISAGQGKTAGRGTKGQTSRTGKGKRPGFEGGQNPLMQRIPKLRGFTPFWSKPITVTTDELAKIGGDIDNVTLYEAKLVESVEAKARVVLGKTELKSKLNVKLQGASQSAISAIQKAGGQFEKVDRIKSAGKKTTDK